jgi:hypothetical protein
VDGGLSSFVFHASFFLDWRTKEADKQCSFIEDEHMSWQGEDMYKNSSKAKERNGRGGSQG